MSESILLEHKNNIATVTLNRPDVHNAFNDEVIEKLTQIFAELGKKQELRLIVLTGAGKSFCAGADLNWMSSMVNYTQEENAKDALALANLFEAINSCPVPVIGLVNGHAMGGGLGLIAVCDYVIAVENAKFAFSEVKLGLIPATIAPYCVDKIGASNARAYMISGKRFDAQVAMRMGLVHQVCMLDNLGEILEEVKADYQQAGPVATRKCKAFLKELALTDREKVKHFTCDEIANIRISKEGQLGMQALLNKTKALWVEK